MAHFSKKSRRSSNHALAVILIFIVIFLTMALILGVLAVYHRLSDGQEAAAAEPVPVSTEPQPTVPAPVVTADGQPDSPLCRNSYSVMPSQAAPEKAVASYAGETLDNAALQIYYLNAIRS